MILNHYTDTIQHLIVICLFILSVISSVDSSLGDRSWIYQKCLGNCNYVNCTDDATFIKPQSFHLWLLRWDCITECKYWCMWATVDAFILDGSRIPQFHGKWPFIRFLGIQEPASVVFSVLNGLCHLKIFKFRKMVPSDTPMYYVWHGSAMIGLNAWFWSVIFHTRDTDFTEKMDYFSAFSLVLYNSFLLSCRITGTKTKRKVFLMGAFLLMFYLQHIHYLSAVKFDYGYNMQVNITVGLFNVFGWIIWCCRVYKKQRYVWKCAAVLLLLNILALLELGDFPPYYWVFDSHSLWHAGTAPLGLLWYSFAIDDCLYLEKENYGKTRKLP